MDALRILLLSLMIGQNVSGNANFTEVDFVPMPPAIVAASPTSSLIWDPSAQVLLGAPVAPTQRPSGLSRNLRLGMRGDDVRRVQRLLSDLGYDVAVGGTFSAKMEDAVMLFQHVNGLIVDGIVGPQTYRKLTSRSALGPSGHTIRTLLSYGMKGQDVMELQMRLGQLGYYDDVISGNYLKNTRKAVYAFQEVHGLYADGIADHDTLYLIFSSMAVQAPKLGGQRPGATMPPNPRPPSPTKPGTGQTTTPPPLYMRTLSMGSSGADVLHLTTRLQELGYYPYEPTSFFGEDVYWAVYTFQQLNRLTPDGIAGKETLTRVYATDAIPFSTGPQQTPTPGPTGRPQQTPTPGPTGRPQQTPPSGPTGRPQQTPTPTPTIPPTEEPATFCEQCRSYILEGEESDHAPNLAECGVEDHYPCDGLPHEKQPCDVHFQCLPDRLNHQICPVARCNRPLCDRHTH